MSFFQNPFAADFIGVWLLGDRQYNPDFKVPRNQGRGDELVSVYTRGPYDLSGNDADGNPNNVLTITFAIRSNPKGWSDLPVTITGASLAAITPTEIMGSLAADTRFQDYFTSKLDRFDNSDQSGRLVIKQNQDATRLRFYIKNTGAESVLRFNKYAGIAELPSYFDRHTVNNRFTYTDSQNALVPLDPGTSNVDAAIIDNAVDAKGNSLGLSHSTVQADWQLLSGKSGLFTFHKNTYDGSSRLTASIEYPAGAKAGDFAKMTTYSYDSTNTSPSVVAEVPYVLQADDLITPP